MVNVTRCREGGDMAETITRRRRDDRQEQAEELRRVAGTVHSASLREILIEIADEYERVAARRGTPPARD
jgi:hypothetical protein